MLIILIIIIIIIILMLVVCFIVSTSPATSGALRAARFGRRTMAATILL